MKVMTIGRKDGKTVQVKLDDADAERLSKSSVIWTWRTRNKKKVPLSSKSGWPMANVVLDHVGRVVHRNGDTLDLRRSNLTTRANWNSEVFKGPRRGEKALIHKVKRLRPVAKKRGYALMLVKL